MACRYNRLLILSDPGRETFLVPVTWEDDWPVFNGGQKATLEAEAPGLYQVETRAAWRDDFTVTELQLGWYRESTSVKRDYSLTDRPGYLRTNGSPYNLGGAACPTLFLRKQMHHSGVWQTRLSFQPNSVNTEAGSVVYWNYFTYSSIGIRLCVNGDKRVIRWRPAESNRIDKELSTIDADVVLIIECGDRYKFGFQEVFSSEELTDVVWVGEISSSLMTVDPPVGLPFTGMMLGLYAFGEMEKCLVLADFKYAQTY